MELPDIVIWSWSVGLFLIGYMWVKFKFKK